MEETISLQEMFEVVKKRASLILFTTVIGLVVSTIATFLFITPKFESQVSLMVKTNNSYKETTDIATYKELAKSDVVLDGAVKDLSKGEGLHFTSGQLRGIIDINQPQNSQLFYLKTTTTDAEQASLIANAVAKNFKNESIKIIPENKLEIISSATANHSPVSPNKKMNLAIGVLVGLMLGVGLAFMLDFLDQTIRNRQFVESLDLPILGEVSEIRRADLQRSLSMKPTAASTQPGERVSQVAGCEKKCKEERDVWFNTKKHSVAKVPLVALLDSKSTVAEQFRMLRSSIRFSEVDQKIKTLLITSSGMSEGKSLCASNLAVVFAQAESKVLLVDSDFRRPTVHLTWSVSNGKGLSNLLLYRENSLADYVKLSSAPNLDLLASGSQPPNPSELFETQRMREVLDETASKYDLVIIDASPLAMVTDSQILASRVDGTILVARERKTKSQELKQAVDLLKQANAKVLGVIYNGRKPLREYNYSYSS